MRIGIDAAPLAAEGGGITRYAGELSLALARCFPEDEFVLLSGQPFRPPRAAPPNLTAAAPARGPLEQRWWSAGLPLRLVRERIEVFHGCDFSVPYLPVRPSVMTLHDLSPWLPEYAPAGADRVRRRAPALIGLGLATLIVTPGEAVRRQAIGRFRLDPGRVAAIPLAAPSRFRPVPRAGGGKPYFLFLGNLDRRKNLALLIEAWRELSRCCEVELVLAGRRREDTPPFPPLDGLRLAGPVAENDLPALYSGCVAFLYPSLYEGFGLPVLEAMQCGAAVMVSRDPALVETAGEAGIVLDGGNPGEWAEAMLAAVLRPDWLQARREASLRRAAAFSWESTARRTREVYDEAAARF